MMVNTSSAVGAYMDIDDYLREKVERLEKGIDRVRDSRVFDYNFIPPRPLMRAELRPVIDALVRYEKTGIANHLLIVGSRGSGKTLSILYLRRQFEARGLAMLYVNCRVHNTSYKILAHLLDVKARGVSSTELTERFTEHHARSTVVVLDEVDLLSEKDKNKDVLYFLSRAPHNYMTVMLSNNPKWSTMLDESIQSTLQPEVIYFRPYTTVELRDILDERARLGLRQVDEETVSRTAALTAKYANADVRVAIKTLYYWAVEPAPLDTHFEKARRDIVVEVVRNLSDKNLLILKAAGLGEHKVKDVYAHYRDLCARHHELPFSYVYFYSNLAYLQSLGLVLLVSTKVRRAYTNVLQLTFPNDILDAVWRFRFA